MSRATFVYVVMLAVFGAGLWAILSFGSILLRAPEDLAGEWQLFDPRAAGPDDDPVMRMQVEQSGQFFNVRINGVVDDMKLIDQQRYTDRATERNRAVLNGQRARLTFDGVYDANTKHVRATGALSGEWLARRMSRPSGTPDPHPTPASQPAAASHARLF